MADEEVKIKKPAKLKVREVFIVERPGHVAIAAKKACFSPEKDPALLKSIREIKQVG